MEHILFSARIPNVMLMILPLFTSVSIFRMAFGVSIMKLAANKRSRNYAGKIGNRQLGFIIVVKSESS
jgi:hypothetical protein